MTYTTISDVVLAIRDADPGFGELSDEQLEGIVRDNRENPYERMTDEEFENMVIAAYEALGIPREEIERIVY